MSKAPASSRAAPRATPRSAAREKKPFPTQFVMTSLAASLNLTAGLLGLMLPESFPGLASPPLAFSLVATGIALEIWAVKLLIARNR